MPAVRGIDIPGLDRPAEGPPLARGAGARPPDPPAPPQFHPLPRPRAARRQSFRQELTRAVAIVFVVVLALLGVQMAARVLPSSASTTSTGKTGAAVGAQASRPAAASTRSSAAAKSQTRQAGAAKASGRQTSQATKKAAPTTRAKASPTKRNTVPAARNVKPRPTPAKPQPAVQRTPAQPPATLPVRVVRSVKATIGDLVQKVRAKFRGEETARPAPKASSTRRGRSVQGEAGREARRD